MGERKHKHHLIPRHMGGTDDEDNLTPPISIPLHAEFHRVLYEDFGRKEDLIAWKALSGRITSEEARLEAAKEGQNRSDAYKNRDMKDHLNRIRTKESASKGGKAASIALIKWIKENKEVHADNVRKSAKKRAEKQKIPHEYNGVVYDSKKSLQLSTGLSNCGFYGKLKRGEIKRLIKELETEGNDG
jgi:hypothetical protein